MEEIIFKRPELEDKEILNPYFKKYPSRSCERTFVNVFLWSRFYNVEYAIVGDAVIYKNNNEELAFAYPIGSDENVKRAIDVLIELYEKDGSSISFYNVTEEQFIQLEKWYPNQYQIEYDRDIADYVYEREKLATLSGKKLHGKRNHINKFKATNQDWSYESLSEENLEECFQMALKWRGVNGCEKDEEKNAEMCVTLNSLRLFRELDLVGGILRVNGEIAAFTMGEEVCQDTFVVHIEKAFAELDGAYPMINQQFVQHECVNYTYINREEDVGVEGLRKAKLSYRPVFLIEKGNVTKKEN